MKKLLFVLLLLVSFPAVSEIILGPNGVWYGNICIVPRGWQYVQWQPVGSVCYSPMHNQWGSIANR